MSVRIVFLSALIALAFSKCKNDSYNPDVCFQQNVLPIFISKCSMQGCHSAIDKVEGYDFSNYEGIMEGVKAGHPLRSEVYRSIKGKNPSMPVGGQLEDKEVALIKDWIKMGAHNTTECTNCDSANITYTSNIKPIITNWCLGCHSSSNASGAYDFSVYSGLVKAVTNGSLLGSIKHQAGYVPMPTGNKLSDCDIATIEIWVNAGYPNN